MTKAVVACSRIVGLLSSASSVIRFPAMTYKLKSRGRITYLGGLDYLPNTPMVTKTQALMAAKSVAECGYIDCVGASMLQSETQLYMHMNII